MDHQETESVAAPVALYGDDADAAFEEMFAEEAQEGDSVEDGEEEAELDVTENQGEDDDEPEAPAIVPPSSLTAAEKEAFTALDSEAQTLIAEIEGRRNAQVTRVTTEAAEAKRTAEAQARAEYAQNTKAYAAEIERYAEAFRPQQPDPSLIATNPQAYAYEMAQYQQLQAHSENLAKQAQAAKSQAEAAETQARQEWDRQQYRELIAAVPDWADAKVMQENMAPIIEMARERGFDDETLSSLSANDVLLLKELHDLQKDRAELQKLRKVNMEKVRSFKGKTVRPGIARSSQTVTQKAATDAMARLKANPYDAKAQEDAFAAFV